MPATLRTEAIELLDQLLAKTESRNSGPIEATQEGDPAFILLGRLVDKLCSANRWRFALATLDTPTPDVDLMRATGTGASCEPEHTSYLIEMFGTAIECLQHQAYSSTCQLCGKDLIECECGTECECDEDETRTPTS